MPRVGYVKGSLYISMSLTKTLIDIQQGFILNHNFFDRCMSIDCLPMHKKGRFNIIFAFKNLLK
jgi:hypothetical protein